ncbi:MAG: hypothetical protein ACE5O2_14455, partial [Armatimonadota bacterium]
EGPRLAATWRRRSVAWTKRRPSRGTVWWPRTELRAPMASPRSFARDGPAAGRPRAVQRFPAAGAQSAAGRRAAAISRRHAVASLGPIVAHASCTLAAPSARQRFAAAVGTVTREELMDAVERAKREVRHEIEHAARFGAVR